MRVRCRLGEIMDEQRMSVKTLRARTGLSATVIAKLRGPEMKNVELQVILKICDVLGVKLDELFLLYPEDIWAPIKISRELTIHYGSRTVRAAARSGVSWLPQFVGSWDLRAYSKISDYVREHCPGTNIRLKEHFVTDEAGVNSTARPVVPDVFERGNHLILGSPVANPMGELAVCYAYNVAPYDSELKRFFPYAFIWDTRAEVRSSFGWRGKKNGEFGIASPVTGEMVARRTVVTQGQGDDCALILVQRIEQSRALREGGGGDERVIIALLGHTGVGTFAAASIVTDPKWLPGVFPPAQGEPFMRAVWAKYNRVPAAQNIDPRELSGVGLV